MVFRIGLILAIVGLLIEAIGSAAMAFYTVRRRLPIASPLPLFGVGGIMFVIGVVMMGVGRAN
jgi:hypothetical protein